MCFSVALPSVMVQAIIVRAKYGFIGHFIVSRSDKKTKKLQQSFERLEQYLDTKIVEKSFSGTLSDLRSEIFQLNQAHRLPGVRSRFVKNISLLENHVNLSLDNQGEKLLMVA